MLVVLLNEARKKGILTEDDLKEIKVMESKMRESMKVYQIKYEKKTLDQFLDIFLDMCYLKRIYDSFIVSKATYGLLFGISVTLQYFVDYVDELINSINKDIKVASITSKLYKEEYNRIVDSQTKFISSVVKNLNYNEWFYIFSLEEQANINKVLLKLYCDLEINKDFVAWYRNIVRFEYVMTVFVYLFNKI